MLSIEQVLSYLDITEGMNAAEFGCGAAHFALALARKLKHGRVYALDIQADKISALEAKIKQANMHNISPIRCDLETPGGSTLSSDQLDIVLVPNTLFQAANKDAIVTEAKRILKPGGQLLILDWLKKMPLHGNGTLVSPTELKKLAWNQQLTLQKEFSPGDYHYAIIFTKS